MRITSEIFQVGGAGYTVSEDAAVYLLAVGGQAALVDAGCGGSVDRLLAQVRTCGVDPSRIQLLLLTHCHFDHTGGAAAVRERTSCRIVAHELDAGYLEVGDEDVTAASWYGASLAPTAVDWKLSGAGQELELGGRTIHAIHIPGHSPGSLAYLMESDGLRVLFGQDVHGPIHPDLLSDRERYLESLERLLSLEADILCEGHYGIYRGRKKVEDFIRGFLIRS